MSKIFRRPMFRKGGNVGEGIMTGIVDRGNYEVGGSASERLMKVMQDYPVQTVDPVAELLISAGLRGFSETGGGSTFGNLAKAFEDPTQQYFKRVGEQGKAKRDLALAGEQLDIQQDYAKDLLEAEGRIKKDIAALKTPVDPFEALKFETEFKRYAELGLPSNVIERAANHVVKQDDQVISIVGAKRYGGVLNFNVSDRKEYESNKPRLIELGRENKIVFDPFENNYKRITMVGNQPQFDEAESVEELMQIPLPTISEIEKIDRSGSINFGLTPDQP